MSINLNYFVLSNECIYHLPAIKILKTLSVLTMGYFSGKTLEKREKENTYGMNVRKRKEIMEAGRLKGVSLNGKKNVHVNCKQKKQYGINRDINIQGTENKQDK